MTLPRRMIHMALVPLTVLSFGIVGCAGPGSTGETQSVPENAPSAPEPAAAKPDADLYGQLAMLGSAMDLLQRSYVDADRATVQRMMAGALKGMMRELDPYSTYEPPREPHTQPAPPDGRQPVGVGLNLVKNERDPLLVVGVTAGSPAADAGLRAGDRITAIDRRATTDLTFEDCRELLSGVPGSGVTLRVVREGEENALEVRLIRRNFPVVSGPVVARRLEGDIGYVRIESFHSRTAAEMENALRKLREDGGSLKGLILDLRNNPGGMVSAAVALCSHFLEPGKVVFLAEGRTARESYRAETRETKMPEWKLPLVVLVNRYSASAAEIVAGCLQDYRRAQIVGQTTFGKGSIQRRQVLPNGGAMRYTIARYQTPLRRRIDAAGIRPDVEVPLSDRQTFLLARQSAQHPGEIRPDTPGAVADVQLAKALEMLHALTEKTGGSELKTTP